MFADILKGLRAESHISQGKLAESIGVSPGNVSTWEGGEAKPGYAALYSLARFFGVSADYLLELSPQKKSDADNEYNLVCDGSPLSDEETDLIAMYRFLPDHKKEDAFDIIHTLYQKHVERKKDSIYWTYKEDSERKSGTVEGHENQSGTA